MAEARVALGRAQTVGLELAADLSVPLPVIGGGVLSGEVIYQGPFKAPLPKGAPLAELHITRDGLPDIKVPLVTSDAVEPGGFLIKLTAATQHLLARLNAGPEGAS